MDRAQPGTDAVRRRVAAAASVLTLTMTGLVAGCGAEPAPDPAGSTGSTGPVDVPVVPPSSPVTALDAGGAGWAMAATADALWVQVDPPVDAIVRIDRRTGRTRPAVPGGHQVRYGPEGLWVVGEDWLAEVDETTGREVRRIPVAGDIAVGGGAVWVFDETGLRRVDAGTGKVGAPLAAEAAETCRQPAGLVVAFDSAWVACKEGQVVRMPLDAGEVTALPTAPGSHTFTVTDDAVWVTNYQADSVSRIDPESGEVTTVPGAGIGAGITSGGGYVWASAADGIARIDPESATIIDKVGVGDVEGRDLYELVWDDGIVWATTRSRDVLRVDVP